MRDKVLVLGSSFGGLTAALAVKHELHGDVDVEVIAPVDRFVFNPSLIWLPFGKRDTEDLSFPVSPIFADHGIDFTVGAATAVDPDQHQVTTADGVQHRYDHLVIATGYRNALDAVPGLAENGATITSLEDAVHAREKWRTFLRTPGDVVVGAAAGASCFGAAYEFLFNTSYQLRKHGLHDRVRLHYVTAEPELGHFGIGGLPHGESLLGMFTRKEGIEVHVGAQITGVDSDEVVLADGTAIPSAYSMVVPPFVGQQVVHDSPALGGDAKGYVPVRGTYQTEKYDDVYTVGIAAAVPVPWQTAIPVGIPKTGYPTEVQAHTAAKNIAAQIRGERPEHEQPFADIKAICVMDAGNNGVVILADKMLPPRKHGVLVPGPQAHAMKLAFERYFIWKVKHGYVQLP